MNKKNLLIFCTLIVIIFLAMLLQNDLKHKKNIKKTTNINSAVKKSVKNIVKLSDEVKTVVLQKEPSEKYIDYDKYLENNFKKNNLNPMHKKIFQYNSKVFTEILNDIRNALKNNEKKSVANYTKRLFKEIFRLFQRKHSDTYIYSVGTFINKEISRKFSTKKEVNWLKNFRVELFKRISKNNNSISIAFKKAFTNNK